jgi:hypothetical protein
LHPQNNINSNRPFGALKTYKMSRQINFYTTEDDKAMLANVLSSVFGQLIVIPFYKGDFFEFDIKTDGRKLYLADGSRKNDIFYRTHEYYDNTTAELLDYRKSPVLEYSISFKNSEGVYVAGRFYCCSDDAVFSKKVSGFFTKFKKKFWYVKKWKVYVSKSIDVENTPFLMANRNIKIAKDDLS